MRSASRSSVYTLAQIAKQLAPRTQIKPLVNILKSKPPVSGVGSMERLEILRDSRKLFLDRLIVALELYEDSSLVFPAKRRFLLDWLLDNFYRLLKSGSPKIHDVMRAQSFWVLLHKLLVDSDTTSNLGKRKRETDFNRPFIPILTVFLDSSSSCYDTVKACLKWAEEHEEVLSAPTKYLEELMGAAIKGTHPAEILSSVLRILCIWIKSQSNKKRAYNDLVEIVLLLLPKITDEAVLRETLNDFFLCKDIFHDIYKGSPSVFDLILSSDIDLCTYLDAFIILGRERLPATEFRTSVMTLFKKIQDSGKAPLAKLVEEVVEAKISSCQNDTAWEVCKTVLEQAIVTNLDPVVYSSILRVDMGLVTPHISRIFEVFGPGWEQLFLELAKCMSDARQLDCFIIESSKTCQVGIDLALMHKLRPLIANLYSGVLHEIVRSLMDLISSVDSIRQANALRWLNLFATVNPRQIVKYLDDLVKLPPSQDLFELLQLVVDVVKDLDEDAYQKIAAFASSSLGIQVALAVKGHGDLPDRLQDPVLSYRYLPHLLVHGTDVCLTALPEWILKSAKFWEALPNVGKLLLANLTCDNLLSVLRNLPAEMVPNANVALECLRVLDREGQLDEPSIIKLLQNQIDLPKDLIEKLLTIGAPSIKELLFSKGKVSAERIIQYGSESLENMIGVVGILAEINDLPPSMAFKFLEWNTVIDVSEFYRLATVLCRVHASPAKFLSDIQLTAQQRWKLRVALYDANMHHLSDVKLDSAMTEFLHSNVLSQTDMARFIKGSEPKDIASVLDQLGDFPFSDRLISLLDSFLIQSVEVQLIACPTVDKFISRYGRDQPTPTWIKLIHHRAVCGSTNLSTFQDKDLFDTVLSIVSVQIDQPSIPPLLTVLFQYHWLPLMSRRPLLIAILLRILSQPRTARLLLDFATHRQSDQQYYVYPLLLAYGRGHGKGLLEPAMCMLLKWMEGEKEDEEVKYFDGNPMERLLRMAESDDSKVILRKLIKTFREEYKYTGKA